MRLSAVPRLLRLQNVFTAAADACAGFGWTGGQWDWGQVGLAAGASACLYSGGMALNDVCDAKRDRTLHPERPIPSGAIPVTAAFSIAAVLLAAGILLATRFGPRAAAAAVQIAIFIVAYDAFGKTSRVAGPLCMGLLRGLNFALGMAAGGALFHDPGTLLPAANLAAFVAVLTLLSTFEEGRRPKGLLAGLVVVAAGALAAPLLYVRMPVRAAGPALLAAGSVLLVGVQAVRRDPDRFLPLVIRTGVRSIIPFGAAILLGTLDAAEPGLVVLGFLAPTWLLGRWLRGS
ncbi:MAG: UbiA family prenyltransferase [Candidatus Brocadiae bacterium]|nr:UbiA family prenyltransferase [Candidatus Brocadiia bacterium]